jgi:hypothetical protein
MLRRCQGTIHLAGPTPAAVRRMEVHLPNDDAGRPDMPALRREQRADPLLGTSVPGGARRRSGVNSWHVRGSWDLVSPIRAGEVPDGVSCP